MSKEGHEGPGVPPQEQPKPVESREEVRTQLIAAYKKMKFKDAARMVEEQGFSESEKLEIIKVSFHEALAAVDAYTAGELLSETGFGPESEVYKTPEAKAAVLRGVEYALLNGKGAQALALVEQAELTPDQWLTPENQELAKQGMIWTLVRKNISGYKLLKEKFKIPDDFTQSKEVRAAAFAGIRRVLATGPERLLADYTAAFGLTKESIPEPELEGLIEEQLAKLVATKLP